MDERGLQDTGCFGVINETPEGDIGYTWYICPGKNQSPILEWEVDRCSLNQS